MFIASFKLSIMMEYINDEVFNFGVGHKGPLYREHDTTANTLERYVRFMGGIKTILKNP